MGNSSKKIENVIDQSLLDIKNFKILYDQKSLRLESQVPSYTDLFILVIILPPTALLIYDIGLWSLIAAFSHFLVFSSFYLRVINSFNTIYLNSENKTIEITYSHGISKLIKGQNKIKFNEVSTIKVDSMASGKHMSKDYFLAIRSTGKKFKTLIINDEFKVKRLKFVLDEFIRSSDN